VERNNPVHIKWADRYNTIECAFSLVIACLINTSVIVGMRSQIWATVSKFSPIAFVFRGMCCNTHRHLRRRAVSAAVFFPNEDNGYRVVPHLDEIGFLDAGTLLDDTLGGYVRCLSRKKPYWFYILC
jgi:hypothetical protein